MKLSIQDDAVTFEVDLNEGDRVVVGRDASSDVVLKTGGVSRNHAELSMQDGVVWVRDLGSKNGIRINGKNIEYSELSPTDELQIGLQGRLRLRGREMAEKIPVVSSEPEEEATPEDVSFSPEQKETLENAIAPAVSQPSEAVTPQSSPQTPIPPIPGESPVASGGGVDPSLQANSPEKKGPSKLLKVAIAVFAIVMIAVVAAGMLMKPKGSGAEPRKPGDSPSPNTQTGTPGSGNEQGTSATAGTTKPVGPMTTKQKYFHLIDQAVKHLEGRRFTEARSYLQQAAAIQVKFDQVGELLEEYCDLMQKGGNKFNFDWEDTEQLLEDIEVFYPTSDGVIAFVKGQQSWMTKEGQARPILGQIKLAMDAKDIDKAYGLLAKLPKDGELVKVAQPMVVRVKKLYRDRIKESAEKAFDEKRWQMAITEYNRLKAFVNEEQAKGYDERIEEAQENLGELTALNNARKQLRNNNPEQVLAELKKIPMDSMYAKQAKKIRDNIQHAGKYEKAVAVYHTGNIAESLALLAELKSKDARVMSQKLQRVLKEYTSASKSLLAREPQQAVTHWSNILAIETDASNFYVNKARSNLTKWKSANFVAKQFMQWAEEERRNKNFAEARAMYAKAKAADPNGLLGEIEVKEITKEGVLTYNQGLAVVRDNPQDGVKLFRQALQMLPKSHQLVPAIQKSITEAQ